MSQPTLQLVSMPWASPASSSIQIGCLKAYADQVFAGRLDISAHSGFFSILDVLFESPFEGYDALSGYQEYPYFLLYARRYLDAEVDIDDLIDRLNTSQHTSGVLTPALLDRLETATIADLDSSIVPRLTGRDVIGFTLNFFQVYASLFAARHLQDVCGAEGPLFLLGGSSVNFPEVAQVVRRTGIPGLGVIGEGERKLELIVGSWLEDSATVQIASDIPGVYELGDKAAGLFERNVANYKTQFAAMDELPIPDFDEYFDRVRKACSAEVVEKTIAFPMEGSRGCFAHCDFCGDNVIWNGFRSRASKRVFEQAMTLTERYGHHSSHFVDNVCDSWAESFADDLIRRGQTHATRMEMRVHHPERFWTKLALAGVWAVQTGIEALSEPLLQGMNKGTTVMQNLMAHKYLCELGVQSRANLIINHPKSTLADIDETRRVIEHIRHMERLRLSDFSLTIGSPLYDALKPEERRNLKQWTWATLPEHLAPHFVSLYVRMPDGHELDPEVRRGWYGFGQWYEDLVATSDVDPFELSATQITNTATHIRGSNIDQRIEGNEHHVYALAHRPRTVEALAAEACLPPGGVAVIVAQFVTDRLMIRVGDEYLSLALRPRSELVARYEGKQAQPATGSVSRVLS